MSMLTTHTTHIFGTDRGWVVVRDRLAVDKKPHDGSGPATAMVYATQKEAVEAARKIVEKEPAAQIVVHSRNGSMRRPYIHGLPAVQRSPVKSDLGTRAIKRAVSTALRERLIGQ